MIVVVTGIPRSGTSMMMRMLEAGGVPVFCQQYSDQFNPDGYYEHPGPMTGDFSSVPDGCAVKCLHMLYKVPKTLDARFIVMRRDFSAMLTSERRRAAVITGHSSRGDGAFLRDQLDANRLLVAGRPHVEVWYEDVLRVPANEVLRVARLLGGVPGHSDRPLDLAAMARVPCLR